MKGYLYAVEWLALNDDPSELGAANVRASVAVGLVADLFGKTTFQVARAVLSVRRHQARDSGQVCPECKRPWEQCRSARACSARPVESTK